jgi:hypothetical protein
VRREIRTYLLYGLTVRSTVPLPCRVHSRAASASHVHLRLAPAKQFQSARRAVRSRRWFHRHQLANGSTYLRWRDLCEFLVSADGKDIRFHPLESATAEAINVYLLGQVLSFSLVARGIDPLHGSVVDVGREAVALVGDCGSGKSTLAAALLARGYPIVTDDVVALFSEAGRWNVHPGIPRLKLFPAAVRRVLGLTDAGVPMNRKTTKRVIPLGFDATVQGSLPLKAIYVLARGTGRRADRTIRTERLSGREAFLEVIRGAFNLLVVDRERLRNQFAFASHLVNSVPVYRLNYPRTFSALPFVCDTILADGPLSDAASLRTATA